jgi:hypothetical protein
MRRQFFGGSAEFVAGPCPPSLCWSVDRNDAGLPLNGQPNQPVEPMERLDGEGAKARIVVGARELPYRRFIVGVNR